MGVTKLSVQMRSCPKLGPTGYYLKILTRKRLNDMISERSCTRGMGIEDFFYEFDYELSPEILNSLENAPEEISEANSDARQDIEIYWEDKMCQARSFGARSAVIFKARSFNMIDVQGMFEIMKDQLLKIPTYSA